VEDGVYPDTQLPEKTDTVTPSAPKFNNSSNIPSKSDTNTNHTKDQVKGYIDADTVNSSMTKVNGASNTKFDNSVFQSAGNENIRKTSLSPLPDVIPGTAPIFERLPPIGESVDEGHHLDSQ
jgi:hypothetical protein